MESGDGMGNLLPFQRQIVEQLVTEDGLCIMAAGLGWQKVAAVLLRVQIERRRDPREHGAVIVLGCSDWQRQVLLAELLRVGGSGAGTLGRPAEQPAGDAGDGVAAADAAPQPPEAAAGSVADRSGSGGDDQPDGAGPGAAELPPVPEPPAQRRLPPGAPLEEDELPADVTNEIPSLTRIELYRRRPCLLVTARILVVDLLTGRLQPQHVAGMLVMNAHRVVDSSGEAFAVRLYRIGNRRGFLRALSDQPAMFTSGFNKIEKTLKALFIRRLYLWPRYQGSVKDTLGSSECELVELQLRLTPSMALIYEALTDLLEACLRELKKSRNIDTSDMTLEQGLFKDFDAMIRRQLDATWHTLGPKVKQLADDLRTLRTLAEYLLQFDAITFLVYLENLRATEGAGSVWLFLDPAHTVFEQAKRRVYTLKGVKRRRPGQDSPAAAGAGLEAVLEELPKWSTLLTVLQEVQQEILQEHGEPEGELDAGLQDEEAAGSPGDSSRRPTILVVAQEERTCAQLRQCARAGSGRPVLQQLFDNYLLHRLEHRDGRPAAAAPPRAGAGGGRGRSRSQGRGRAQATQRMDAARAVQFSMRGATPVEEQALLRQAQALIDEEADRGQAAEPAKPAKGRRQGREKAAASGAEPRKQAAAEPAPEEDCPLLAGVTFHALDSRQDGVLWDVQPTYVVMYNPNMAFIRQLEVYNAERPGQHVRMYHLVYEDSFESDKFVAGVDREVHVFSELIKAKEVMALPDLAHDLQQVQPGPKALMHPDVEAALPGTAYNALTRRAGGRNLLRPQPKRVVVDVREFMSSLPAVLHQQGLDIVPVTLEVADYILSPDICIERKSIQDLRQSLASGRLAAQAESMVRHYPTPMLLIEFDRDRAFMLNAEQDISSQISAHSLISRLCLLILHFPRLRIIWSRSLHATADMFRTLKSNQDEPDADSAAAVGVPVDEVPGEAVINTAAVDLLRRLPGVSDATVRPLMNLAPSLAELAQCSLAQLQEATGGRKSAALLHEWLHAPCPAV